MSQPTIPLIICGKVPDIARMVISQMKPEYEVIHVITSTEQGIAELPSLLRGAGLPDPRYSRPDMPVLGTQRFDRAPAAVVIGGGYDDAMVQSMRDACKNESRIPWLHRDSSQKGGPTSSQQGYGESAAARVNAKLQQMRDEEGSMDRDGLHRY